MSNIVGNPFKPFVIKQITARQKILSEVDRGEQFLKYVSKTPWLRMASSINVNDREKADKLGLPIGDEAARQFVLQGGSLGVSKNISINGEKEEISYTSLGQKFGVATDNSIINQNSYGFGGSDWGKTPMPGLTSVTIEDFNRGAIRKAKVDFTCTNIQQFEIISTLYMRVGYNVLIEWGHSAYLNNQEPPQLEQRLDFNTPAFTSFFEGKNTNTLLNNIKTEQENTYGNYDAFMGRVTNFNWKFLDGKYECSITVLTQGDVIDSLKVNVSLQGKNPPEKIDQQLISTTSTEIQAREDALTRQDAVSVAGASQAEINANLAEIARQNKEQNPQNTSEIPSPPIIPSFIENRDSNIISGILYNNYIKLTKNQIDNSGQLKNQDGFVEYLKFADGNLKEYFYVSLGKLLKIIETNNLLYDKVTGEPILTIDTNYTTNRCARFPEQVSTDWSKCYIPYKVFNAERKEFTDSIVVNELLGSKEKRYDKQNYVGQLMCLLINVDYINQSLIANTDEQGRISLKDFLTNILQGIQSSIGGINDFKIGYDYTTNELKVYDNSPLASFQMVGGSNPTNNNVQELENAKFQSYGVRKGQQGSFLLDIDIQSSLSSNLANMLAAGAQTNGNQIGENATAFSLWNQGLVDRVRPTNLDIQTFDNKSNDQILKDNQSRLKQAFFDNKQKLYELLLNISNKQSSTEDLRSSQAINVDFSNYYLGEATRDTIEGTSYGISPNFFIPFNMGLRMDGLSGMRLFDALSITNEVLPSLYTDSLIFIINGINHSITDAGWITSLSTQTFNQFSGTGNTPELPTAAVTTRGVVELVDENEELTPNADFLRKYLKVFNIAEKGNELSNGGDITIELAWASIFMFKRIRENSLLANVKITVTAGNDLYHQAPERQTSKSRHKTGNGLDFTVATDRVVIREATDFVAIPGWLDKIIQNNIGGAQITTDAKDLIVKWALAPLTRDNPEFRYLNEYKNSTIDASGKHFHISWGFGTEGASNQEDAKSPVFTTFNADTGEVEFAPIIDLELTPEEEAVERSKSSGVATGALQIPIFDPNTSFYSYNGQTGPTFAAAESERKANFEFIQSLPTSIPE
tara:strand:- start:928 stop:4200 length:3273 start_codon:yes stop_codon:yes gene_type:complete